MSETFGQFFEEDNNVIFQEPNTMVMKKKLN